MTAQGCGLYSNRACLQQVGSEEATPTRGRGE